MHRNVLSSLATNRVLRPLYRRAPAASRDLAQGLSDANATVQSMLTRSALKTAAIYRQHVRAAMESHRLPAWLALLFRNLRRQEHYRYRSRHSTRFLHGSPMNIQSDETDIIHQARPMSDGQRRLTRRNPRIGNCYGPASIAFTWRP